MKKTSTAALLFALACASFGLQLTSEPAPTAGRTAQSKTWKVTVVNAERYEKARPNVDPPVEPPAAANLRVDLRFEYIGPTGKVAPPTVLVRNGEKKLAAFENITYYMTEGEKDDYSIIAWLLSARRRKPTLRAVRSGQKFGLHSFYFADVPLGAVNLRLRFADAPEMNFAFKARS
ncbi:MAG TPA: hypothetical protein VFF17_08680 [Thermoanaerobaculia bacterium]|nr:hypothetical protein [Thermoanaerobaculia bacterium]